MSDKTLYDNASDVILCNCKKAMSLVPKLVPTIIVLGDDGSIAGYGSGEREEDFLRYINDGMYMMLKKTPSDPNNLLDMENLNDDDASVDILDNLTASDIGDAIHGEDPDEEAKKESVDVGEEMSTDKKWMTFCGVAPSDYCFFRYFAFACFGPTRGIYFSDLLNPKGNSEEQLKQEKN